MIVFNLINVSPKIMCTLGKKHVIENDFTLEKHIEEHTKEYDEDSHNYTVLYCTCQHFDIYPKITLVSD